MRLATSLPPRHIPESFRDTPLEKLLPFSLEAADSQDALAPIDDEFRVVPTELGLQSGLLQVADDPSDGGKIWGELPPLRWFGALTALKPAARVLAEHTYDRRAAVVEDALGDRPHAFTQPSPKLSFVFCGLSITSSWGNGHATTYRALLRELAVRHHQITFLERDVPWYARNRDLLDAPYAHIALYESLGDLSQMDNLMLQDAMQEQQELFQLLSNLSKSMHDTAKAIISNLKG